MVPRRAGEGFLRWKRERWWTVNLVKAPACSCFAVLRGSAVSLPATRAAFAARERRAVSAAREKGERRAFLADRKMGDIFAARTFLHRSNHDSGNIRARVPAK